jgi:chromosome partitioning protein
VTDISLSDVRGKVLVTATGKGGAGKTTTVACLAAYWQLSGKSVALFDLDPNQTLKRWHDKGDILSKTTLRAELNEHAVIPTIDELADKHDITLVDCAGFNNQSMIFAIGCADLVLIPVMADEANVFEAGRMSKIVESTAYLTKRPIDVRTLLCRVKRAVVAEHARSELNGLDCRPLKCQLNDRVLFQEATFYGSSPTALEPNSPAARDIERLAREVESIIWATSRDAVAVQPTVAPH